MIALASQNKSYFVTEQVSQAFEAILPSIERMASYAFRSVPRWRRTEMVADVVAAAYTAFVRLIERGLESLIFPTALANYAIKHVRDGRQVDSRRNANDVLSLYAQRRKEFQVERLPQACLGNGWEELTEHRRANPADVAALRVDLHDWLSRLQQFKRRVAMRLAIGDTTSDAARHFKLSEARISQLRRELRADWEQFQAVPGAA